MFKFLKPQANHIYYDRKIEYINLVEQNKKIQKKRADEMAIKQARLHEQYLSEYDRTQKDLINIMEKFDIKHPMRGP